MFVIDFNAKRNLTFNIILFENVSKHLAIKRKITSQES